jgi:hypothetical protein
VDVDKKGLDTCIDDIKAFKRGAIDTNKFLAGSAVPSLERQLRAADKTEDAA